MGMRPTMASTPKEGEVWKVPSVKIKEGGLGLFYFFFPFLFSF